MKHLISNIILLGFFFIFSHALFAQSLSGDKEPYQIYNEAAHAYRNNNYEEAFTLFHEYITMTNEYVIKDNSDYSLLGSSYYHIGCSYLNGYYVKKNVDSAIINLTTACCKYKNGEAARLLSHIYMFKKYEHLDLEKSFYFLRLAADLHDIKSNIELGQIYLSGSSKCMKDTIIYTYHNEINKNGDTIRYRSTAYGFTPTAKVLVYSSIKIDSIKGYKYYERGIETNYKMYNEPYSLHFIDFARAYMDGTYCPQNFFRAWEFLKNLDDELSEHNEFSSDAGEIYWRMQTCYRFGLGTRANLIKANIYLIKSAEHGFPKAIEAVNYK